MTEATVAAVLPNDETPTFDLPAMEIPPALREVADRGVAQARVNYEQMQAAAEEMVAVLEQTCATTAAGVADYNRKLIEMASAGAHAAFDFACGLMATKSLPEVIELSTAQSRKQFELLTAQNKELWALAGRMATDCAEPIKQRMTKAFNKPVEF